MFAMKFRPAQILILLVLLCLLTSSMFAQGPVILSADGQVLSEMRAGDHITVRRSRRTVRLMHLAGSSFCETLRRKLHWRGTPL